MSVLIYPGSFDPFTIGHEDIARRAAKLCEHLYVAVLKNERKQAFFSLEERLEMVRRSLSDLPNLTVEAHEGLLVDFYQEKMASAVVRGLRSESDFRYESELNNVNKLLYQPYEVILLPCRMDLAYTSSSMVKEVGQYGGDIRGMVPEETWNFVADRLGAKQ